MQKKTKVIIIGGNFAGLNTAKYLSPKLFAVDIIDTYHDFEWLPHIHELISRGKKSEQLRHDRETLIERMGHHFINNTVTAINKQQQTLTLATGEQLCYDHLVVAIGSDSLITKVVGAKEYAIPFNNIADAEKASLQLQRLDSLNLPERPITLIGASIEGLEILGEIIRRYERQWRFKVTVIDSEPVLLKKYQGLDAFIKQQCKHLNINWMLGNKVVEVCKDKVILDNGTVLNSRLTLWCGGAKPHSLLTSAELANNHRYAASRYTLQSIAAPNIWLAGDCLELPHPIAKQAYFALPMGKLVAENIYRSQHSKTLKVFRALPIPSLMSFGHMGFILTEQCAIASPSVIAAKEAVFQANFNLFKLPHTQQEWLSVKDNLHLSLLNMQKLAKQSWLTRSLLNPHYFKAQ